MTPPVEELLFTATSAFDDPEQLRAFLDHACRGDPDLRKRLDALLGIQSEAETFFELQPEMRSETPPESQEGEEEIGAHIGRYRLITRIGAGGCGVVYVAEQEEPVRRKIALKIVKLGMDTRAVIARFEHERQALAQMSHPYITRVLDAGITNAGRPYFVMELVEGDEITDFCDANRLNIRNRLELFVQVCSAVQHAHQKGLIHRDIKPSNVLVHLEDGIPVPKIIDFGIAKATAESMERGETFTQLGQFLGTPAYMSPEQAQGIADIDTRSDIYSLGVMLYQLLCGRPPFDLERFATHTTEKVRDIIQHEEPVPPSRAFRMSDPNTIVTVASNRGTDSQQLLSRLACDLDWIVLKAMEKDRSRRYQTANGLAQDIQRFLSNEPVLARPPSRLYRLGKLARRNKLGFAAGSISAFALISGFSISTLMFLRERDARHLAEELQREEAHLYAEADAREKIAQAALLIDRNRIAEVGQLLDQISIPVSQPSLEAARVYRTMAEWNVTRGRWNRAAERFLQLQQANQLDKSNTTEEMTRDLLGAGPALIVAGRIEDYHRLVHSTLIRFAGTSDPSAAEQVTKNSLILPPDEGTLRQLEPLIKVLRDSLAGGDTSSDSYVPWRPLALSLYEYRIGNFAEAVFWGEKSLQHAEHMPPCVELANIVLSMAFSRLNQPEKANRHLEEGCKPVEERLPNGFDEIGDPGTYETGIWHDWVIARLLCDEAKRLVEGE